MLLIVGDDDQLPSVGAGAVLHDLLRCASVPRVELQTLFRQDPSGDIARNAHAINRGEAPTHLQRFPSAGAMLRATHAVQRAAADPLGQSGAAAPTVDGRVPGSLPSGLHDAAATRALPAGCVFVRSAGDAATASTICETVVDWLAISGYDVNRDVQVLTPMKQGLAGTHALNQRLQEKLNPLRAPPTPPGNERDAQRAARREAALLQSEFYQQSTRALQTEAERRQHQKGAAPKVPKAPKAEEALPREGDPMIQLTNDYEQQVCRRAGSSAGLPSRHPIALVSAAALSSPRAVFGPTQVFNGDVGHVTRVWRSGRVMRFSVAFRGRSAFGGAPAAVADQLAEEAVAAEREHIVEYTRAALGRDIALSYALTVHKAQGSEYPVVIMPVIEQHAVMLYRNLLYTAISRARQLVVLVGSEDVLRRAAQSDTSARRVTLLADRIDDRDFAPAVTRHM